ncbi:mechanosensitive ion channel domain-containing protein [Flavobacterium aurantiibacter]|uniref:Mechanosensitive ion channel protein MscS n=1 Tax=Flavobacterium aurantiibacter TaxID=2023067 RepID=A0A255ZX81_9FLAO|nr:mechanosensitive ion channel domain-containing protein [Flavobacterium aurantiibacter]OYQ46046.1 mechanosensitive ion channel protein MscS [Flavobacterium aurantiibacter]
MLQSFWAEILATLITLAIVVLVRVLAAKAITEYAKHSQLLAHRANLAIRYTNVFLTVLFFVVVFAIWGVNSDDLFVTFTSLLTILGVAFFAQWSILSNITSGIILLFSLPFKIGDTVKILDKDYPIEAEIEDIKAFHTYLRTKSGEIITIPNTVMMQKGISVINDPTAENQEFTD